MDGIESVTARCGLELAKILQEGRRLLAHGWCQGAVAKDAGGRAVEAGSPKVVAFDPLGAIERAALNLLAGDRRHLVQNYYKGFYALAWELHTHSRLAAWNDNPLRYHAAALERFDRALAHASRPLPNVSRVAA